MNRIYTTTGNVYFIFFFQCPKPVDHSWLWCKLNPFSRFDLLLVIFSMGPFTLILFTLIQSDIVTFCINCGWGIKFFLLPVYKQKNTVYWIGLKILKTHSHSHTHIIWKKEQIRFVKIQMLLMEGGYSRVPPNRISLDAFHSVEMGISKNNRTGHGQTYWGHNNILANTSYIVGNKIYSILFQL